MHGAVTFRVKQLATVTASNRTKGDRGIVGAENRRAGFRNRLVHRLGGDRHAVDITQLALIGTETHRGVAFDVLDRFVAFAGRHLNRCGGNIGLIVNKLLGCPASGFGMRDMEQRHRWPLLHLNGSGHLYQFVGLVSKTGVSRRQGAAMGSLFKTGIEAIAAINRTGSQLLLHRLAGHKGLDIVAPFGAAAGMTGQVYCRTPSTGAGDGIAAQLADITGDAITLGVDSSDGHSGHPLVPLDLDHGCTFDQLESAFLRFNHAGTGRLGTGINNRHHFTVSILPVEGRLIAPIVGGHQHQLAAGYHSIAFDIGRYCRGQHAPRNIIISINQWSLNRACRQYHPACPDPVHPLTHLPFRRQISNMVGTALMNSQKVVIVVTVDGGTGQQQYVVHLP